MIGNIELEKKYIDPVSGALFNYNVLVTKLEKMIEKRKHDD
jgi:hypothetical protein